VVPMSSNSTEAGGGAARRGLEDKRVEDLVRRAQGGDIAAFEALVDAFSRPMFNLACRMTGNREDAADLAQEIFVKLHRSIGKFRWKSRFSTWFYALAANTCRSGLRRLRRVSAREVVRLDGNEETGRGHGRREPVDPGGGPRENLAGTEVMERVEAAIGSLNADFRMVIVLRDLQGMTYEEIGQVLGCSIGTVKSRLARARVKVKDRLVREGITVSGQDAVS